MLVCNINTCMKHADNNSKVGLMVRRGHPTSAGNKIYIQSAGRYPMCLAGWALKDTVNACRMSLGPVHGSPIQNFKNHSKCR
ncbi:unnamed protein product, partial [Vitis vinifera]